MPTARSEIKRRDGARTARERREGRRSLGAGPGRPGQPIRDRRPQSENRGAGGHPCGKPALSMFSLPNWLANSCGASYSARPGRQRNSAAAVAKKEAAPVGRGQFDREEVNPMSDAVVHRSHTLHCRG
jgi:hypothetical protein